MAGCVAIWYVGVSSDEFAITCTIDSESGSATEAEDWLGDLV